MCKLVLLKNLATWLYLMIIVEIFDTIVSMFLLIGSSGFFVADNDDQYT